MRQALRFTCSLARAPFPCRCNNGSADARLGSWGRYAGGCTAARQASWMRGVRNDASIWQTEWSAINEEDRARWGRCRKPGRTPGEHLCRCVKSKHGAATDDTRRRSGRGAVRGALLHPPDGLGSVSAAHAHESCSLQHTHKRSTSIPNPRANASQQSRNQACKRCTAYTYAYKCGARLRTSSDAQNLIDLYVSRWPPKASKRRPVEERRRCLQHL
jgi:hypothetical protein